MPIAKTFQKVIYTGGYVILKRVSVRNSHLICRLGERFFFLNIKRYILSFDFLNINFTNRKEKMSSVNINLLTRRTTVYFADIVIKLENLKANSEEN